MNKKRHVCDSESPYYEVNCLHSQQVHPLGLCCSFVWLQLVLLHLCDMEYFRNGIILNGSKECDLFV